MISKIVGLDKITNHSKKVKWCNFLRDNHQELIAEKTILQERIFLCKVVDLLVKTFTTDLKQADAKHAFDHLKQAGTKPVADYMERVVVLASQAGRLLFDDMPAGDRRGKFVTNLTRVIQGL